jgi:esterase/lipase
MKKTKKNLEKIKKPLLIIQSKNDPVVNPISAYEIFNEVKSTNKTIKIIDSSSHVIVTQEDCDELFSLVYEFIMN